MKLPIAVVAATIVAFAPTAFAHSDVKHEKKAARPISTEQTPFGREGDPKKVSRTVNVDMSDQMRFSPAELTIKQGETIRFRVKNSGKVMHEMVIGTLDELKKHDDMMKKHPGM